MLGQTGIEVSPIGLGTVKLGRNVGLKYAEGFELPTDEQAANLLAKASDLGINLLDTAPAYGSSEERLGKLLKGQRDRWVICTKAGEEFDITSKTSTYRFTPESVRQSVERSLSRLQTDRLDIVLLHSDGRDEWIIEESGALEELEHLKQRGLIRAIGVSTKTPEGALLAAARSDVVMLTLNEQAKGDLPAVRLAADLGKGVLVKKALSSGRGAGDVAGAMRFVFSEPGVTSVIVGTINPGHLEENVGAVE